MDIDFGWLKVRFETRRCAVFRAGAVLSKRIAVRPVTVAGLVISVPILATSAAAQHIEPQSVFAEEAGIYAGSTHPFRGGSYSAPPSAAERIEPEPVFDVEIGADIVSDYRFRGVSLSSRNPAFQPSFTLTHRSGARVGLWGTNIADNGGDDIEVDVMAGYGFSVAGFDLDLSGVYYLYPGAGSANYLELIGTIERSFGDRTLGLLAAYVPSQDATGNEDSVYLAIHGSSPVAGPVSARGSVGWENGAFGNDKLDWALGLGLDLGKGFSAGVDYIDSYRARAGRDGDAAAVFRLGKYF